MHAAKLRRLIRDGKHVTGVLSLMPSSQKIEIYGNHGVDFVVIDMEHTTVSLETLDTLILASKNAGVVPFIRPPSTDDTNTIRRAFDIGAEGIQVPHANDVKTIANVIDAVKCPPEGDRGICKATRSGEWYSISGPDEYQNVNDRITVIGVIESSEGVDNIDEILESGYLDAVRVGLGDLSQSLGRHGEYEHPEVVEAHNRVIEAANEHGVSYAPLSLRGMSKDQDDEELLENGADFLLYSETRLFKQAVENEIFTRPETD